MMERSYDYEAIARAVASNPDVEDFDEDWVKYKRNVALTDGKGNFALFTYEYIHVWAGHYFFENARGKEAIRLSKEALEVMFTRTNCEVLFGLVSEKKKHASWISRQLGFRSYGMVETPKGPYEMFILTKEEYTHGRHH